MPPFQANVRKRLVKSPRVYWRDSGLLHALLNVADREALLLQPWVGASWEGFVIEQALNELSTAGVAVSPYYFRTSDQHELDLVLDFGAERWAVEIKLTSSPSQADFDRLDRAADIVGAEKRLLVTRTTLAERNRVAQRQRRHVAQRVRQQHGVERAELGLGRGVEQDRPADDVQCRGDALGRQKSGRRPCRRRTAR